MLLTGKNWRMKASEQITDAGSALNILLNNRGIAAKEDRDMFLSADSGAWHDPFLYNDMHTAVDIISNTMDSGGKILVYGDYDCDGVTATAILVRYFRSHNADVSYIVPHRAEHGYGLTEKIMSHVIALNPSLVITVDCGITNLDTIGELKARDIKVIVSDHHNVKDELPNADCIICSKRKDNTYPFMDLCGAGVALKIIEALGKDGRHKVTNSIWRQAIELAGLATIADLVSVTDENRTIIKQAFKSMVNPANVGVKVMNEMLLSKGKTLDESFISFNFVPRINAAGRLYDSSDALKLFLENNPNEARNAAQDLTRENEERKEIEAKVFEEAKTQIENPGRPEKWSLTHTCGPIVVYGRNWHQGVLGIVAGKLTQYYNRSAIVFTDDAIEKDCVKGSGRSCGDFDLFGTLTAISDSLTNFGGHKKAAGMMVRKSEMGNFMEALEAESRRQLDENPDSLMAKDDIEIDGEIPFEAVNFDTFDTVCKLRPFGIGNAKPVFVTRNLIISGIYPMSEGAHIRIELVDDCQNGSVSAVGFGIGEYINLLKAGDKVDIAYTMNEYCFRGDSTLSLHLCDIKPHFDDSFIWNKAVIAEKLFSSGLGMKQIAKMAQGEDAISQMIPTPEQFGACYRTIEKFGKGCMSTVDSDLFAKLVNVSTGVKITPFQVKRCFEVFADCGLIKLGSIAPLRLCFSLIQSDVRVKLTDSEVYKRIMNGQD